MSEFKPLVIVLSRNYSTGLSVIRSLGAAGYTVDLIASAFKEGNSEIAASSKYIRNAVEVVTKNIKSGESDEQLIKAIMKYANKYKHKPVLFPTDDYTTSVMDQNRNLFAPYFRMPMIVGGGSGCLTERMDKTLQAQMARDAGLLTPQEWLISLRDEIVIPEDMVYPCFCKPLESVTGYKREMKKCTTESSLKKHLEKLKARYADRSILVQEFLNIDNEIDLSGVCLDQQVIIPAIIKKLNVAKYEKGVTLAGKIVPTEELGDLEEPIIRLLKKFRYVGMFDMELNVVGDKIYFNEVNLRSGGPNYAYFASGVNLPDLFVKGITGKSHAPEEEHVEKYGSTFIYEKVAWEDYIRGYMSRKRLNERIDAADIHLLYNEDDPLPGELFEKEMLRSNLIYELKKKKRSLVQGIKSVLRVGKRILGKTIVPVLRFAKYRVLGYPQVSKENTYNPFAEKPRVVVAGRNYCSNLCMARSLGKAGYEVEILKIYQSRPKFLNFMRFLKPDAYSKYVKSYNVCVTRRRSRRMVNKLISMGDKYRKKILIPADDLVANTVDHYMEKLSRYYMLPNVRGEKDGINNLMSKEVQKTIAKEAGLPVLNSCLVSVSKGGAVEIPDSVTYPCFIKPNISKNSSKGKMRKCESKEELVEVLTEYSRTRSIEMLVEDFVEIDKEYSILGVSTKDGVSAPGFFVAEEGGHDAHRGVALIGRILPCSEEQELIDDIVRFIENLEFNGLFDVDLIKTKEGKMYFVELNLRFGASGYAVTESGVNLPGMYADYMTYGKPVDTQAQIAKAGKTFVSEKVMIEEYITGFLTEKDMKKCMQKVDIHFVKNAEDPQPYEHFRKFYPVAKLCRKMTEVKDEYKDEIKDAVKDTVKSTLKFAVKVKNRLESKLSR